MSELNKKNYEKSDNDKMGPKSFNIELFDDRSEKLKNQESIGVIRKAFDRISAIYEKIKQKLGISDSEAVSETDKILIDNAEQSESLDDFDAILIEGSMEDLGNISSSGLNPIDTVEHDGYSKLVTKSVLNLANKDVILPSGERVADVVVDHLVALENQESEFSVSPEAKRLDMERFCRIAPRFKDQIDEGGRDNLIKYVAGRSGSLSFQSNKFDESHRSSLTEHESLVALHQFLDSVISAGEGVDRNTKRDASDIAENLTWIGEKEYKEAATVYAEMWKMKLRENPNLRIFPVVGQIATENIYQISQNEAQVKSDEWLLENILANFSDEELQEFDDRLIFSEDDIPEGYPSAGLEIILLDDWTISGTQLSRVYKLLSDRMPQYKDCIEIQLIASSEGRIEQGLVTFDNNGTEKKIPLRAYFKAHRAWCAKTSGTRITGFHSSVDYDFETEIEKMVSDLSHAYKDPNIEMPPTTNVVRPYRDTGVILDQVNRARRIFNE